MEEDGESYSLCHGVSGEKERISCRDHPWHPTSLSRSAPRRFGDGIRGAGKRERVSIIGQIMTEMWESSNRGINLSSLALRSWPDPGQISGVPWGQMSWMGVRKIVNRVGPMHQERCMLLIGIGQSRR